MKKLLSLAIILCLLLSSVPLMVSAAESTPQVNPEAYPDFADLSYGALYAHATAGGDSSQTWQRWHKDIQGINYEKNVRYFFLPKTADDNYLEIYNNYGDGSVTIGDIEIKPYTSEIIEYTEGEKITAIKGKGTQAQKSYTIMVLKSDAEASVYINDNTGSYEDANGDIQNTDLWSFLIQSKENSVKGSKCSIVDDNGTLDTTLKKLKGRGNTNWKETDKKPFNLTFDEKTNIGGVVDKKFSFVSNAKDSSLIRNSIMYDLAYNVGSPYASDQSFVDFYVNGVYRGAYIACQKIDLGKNSVVSLKDNSDDMDTGFNFLVEVDVWNYKSDVYFVSDKGYHVVLKTPDLDDYDETDPSMKAKYDYIKETYQELEDALYGGTLADIEKICDLESLASQYLLQEFGKNCDGGYTSSFFTYNAEEGKFYAAPLWDCDSDLGAVDCVRDGCTTSTIDHKGWVTRTATYEKTINPYGQAFYVDGKSSKGQTFEELCSQMWQEKFLPQIEILLGNAEAEGRLKSIDNYVKSTEKYAYNNYVMWDFMWLCAQKNKTIGKTYTKDFDGEIQYLKDWTEARANWMSSMYKADSTEDEITEKTVYFKTDLDWDNIHFYTWGDGYVPMKWPGEKAEIISVNDETGEIIYKAKVTDEVTKIIFNNGADGEQTVNITLTDSNNFYETTNSTGRTNEAKKDIYNIAESYFDDSGLIPETTETATTSSATENTEVTESTAESTADLVPTQLASSETTESTSNATDPAESTPSASLPTKPSSPVSTTTTDPTETSAQKTEGSTVSVTENNSTATTVPQSTTSDKTELVFGDVNLDSKVNIKDATTLQKHLAKILTLSEDALSVADTNRDGKVAISDATTIQKKIAGLLNWD